MSIRTIVKADYDDIVDLSADVFIHHEPMCTAIQMTEIEFKTVFSPIVADCCNNDMSSCICLPDGRIGALLLALSYDRYKQIEIPFCDCSDTVKSILDVLGKLSSNTEAILEKLDPTRIVYFFVICTRFEEGVVKKGFSNLLIDRCMKQALEKGFKYVIADVTNTISQHIFIDKFSFESIEEIYYSDYRYFAQIETTKGVFRVIKNLI